MTPPAAAWVQNHTLNRVGSWLNHVEKSHSETRELRRNPQKKYVNVNKMCKTSKFGEVATIHTNNEIPSLLSPSQLSAVPRSTAAAPATHMFKYPV
jgi:hypothetical protein